MNQFIISIYIFLNLLGFFSMAMDKNFAIKRKWRISELTLMLIAVIGGALGTFIAMKTCRHKTKHTLFKYGIPIILFSHIILFIYFNGI